MGRFLTPDEYELTPEEYETEIAKLTADLAAAREELEVAKTTLRLNSNTYTEELAAHQLVIQQMRGSLTWDLDEQTVKFVSDCINGDDDRLTTITLMVGSVRDDDGSIKHGLLLLDSEYPEEGASMLVESPQIALQPTTDTLEAWYQERVKGELTAKDAEIERLKETIKRWNDGELEKPLEQLAAHQLAISQMREALLWYFDLYAESNVAHLLGKQTQTEALEAYVQAAIEKELESFAAVAATFYSDKNRAADTRGLFSAYAASARKDKQ